MAIAATPPREHSLLLWWSLVAFAIGLVLGVLQPLFFVAVGGFGIVAGPTYVGLLFILCVGLGLFVGLIAAFRPRTRGTTVPILAVSGILALGLIGGNMIAGGLDIGFAAPVAEPTFVPPEPTDPGWSTTGQMLEARHGHTATLLADGRVLVAGGTTDADVPTTSAEIYDPATGEWSATGNMLVPNSGHSATLLANGNVLVIGYVEGVGPDAEIFAPSTGTWTAAREPTARDTGYSGTLLADGRVLLAGGTPATLEGTADSTELYDPATDTWRATATMLASRYQHTATLLADGRVLVTGGMGTGASPQTSAELFDPATETWSEAESMAVVRQGHAAVRIADGRVVVVGGPFGTGPQPIEVYDPVDGGWRALGTQSGDVWGQVIATLVADDRVLVMGWGSEYEVYTPRFPRQQNRPSGKAAHGTGYTVTALLDGRALVVGGVVSFSDGSSMPAYRTLATAHLYAP